MEAGPPDRAGVSRRPHRRVTRAHGRRALELTDSAITDALTIAVALATLIGTKISSAWLIGGGVAVGIAHALIT